MTIQYETFGAPPKEGNGVNTDFPWIGKFESSSEMKVQHTDSTGLITALTEGVHFTASGYSAASGSVTYPKVGSGIAILPADEFITIAPDLPYTQLTNLISQGKYRPEVAEAMADNLTRLIQQIRDNAGRGMVLPAGTSTSFNYTLPSPIANKLFAFAGDGLSMVLADFVDNVFVNQEPEPTTDGSLLLWQKTSTGDLYELKGGNWFISVINQELDPPTDGSVGLWQKTSTGDLYHLKGGAWVVVYGSMLDDVNVWTRRQELSIGAAIAHSGGALTVGTDGNIFSITSTASIHGITAITGGGPVILLHDSIHTLVHNATWLPLPGGVNYTTEPGDASTWINVSGDNWRCLMITKADGTAVISSPDTHKIAQVVTYQTGDVATGTTIIPQDDTIPQNTEGDEYMSLSITPQNAASRLLIEASYNFTNSAGHNQIVALFQDATVNALAGTWARYNTAGTGGFINLKHSMIAGTTAVTTFKVRAGATGASTTTFNGRSGARWLGGVAASSIIITEILP